MRKGRMLFWAMPAMLLIWGLADVETARAAARQPGPHDSPHCDDIGRLRKEGEAGWAEAQRELGKCFYYGKGVPQNDRQAAAWFQKAAKQGDAKAQNSLGTLYYYGHGLGRDEKQAVTWYRKAADKGDADAQNNLGFMYHYGRGGLPQDKQQAAAWYRKAAAQKHGLAQKNLLDCTDR